MVDYYDDFKFSAYISEQDIKYIKERVIKVDKTIQENFEALHISWETGCLNNIATTRSDIDMCAKVQGFEELIKLGNSTIPLYMERLAQEYFLAVVPYKAVQLNSGYLLKEWPHSDQEQAIWALQLWLNAEIILMRKKWKIYLISHR